jgi:hypothetical protein
VHTYALTGILINRLANPRPRFRSDFPYGLVMHPEGSQIADFKRLTTARAKGDRTHITRYVRR